MDEYKIRDITIDSVSCFFDARLQELSFDLGKKLNNDVLEHTITKLSSFFYEKHGFRKLNELDSFFNSVSNKEIKIFSICYSDIVEAFKVFLQKRADDNSKIKKVTTRDWDYTENQEKVKISLQKGVIDETATYSIDELRQLDPKWVENVWIPSKQKSNNNFKKRQNI